ncbi:hypothetical protein JCM21714_4742 [Gracilibacillus boraciitolerans JCM 21714]|uniref:Uncharacterized protein n=1 Tax=Gracilibacillus boraciitolerans JCM 21714 TaxID=1298598 RepID=W4VQ55_9BACI|nr:hypothetical protein JCM21714_4742 [Gracilibacillus boraciitolerans JCM 21714]
MGLIPIYTENKKISKATRFLLTKKRINPIKHFIKKVINGYIGLDFLLYWQ